MADISKSITKVDAAEKAKGQADYIDDLRLEGLLHAKTVRSTVPKARIVRRVYPVLPEGYWIVDHEDIPGENVINIIYSDWPLFAEEEVNHIGEPILLVVGPDKQTVNDLAEQVEIIYEETKPVYDYSESVVDYSYVKGLGAAVFEDADRIIEHTYSTGYQEQLYIEPQGVIAVPEEGQTALYGSMQCPYYIKNALIRALGCGEEDVRVVQTTVGGAFGGKEEFPSLIACQVAAAAIKTGHPVKLIYTREEDVAFTTKRHPSTIRLECAVDAKQRILGIRAHVSLNGGAYIGLSGVVLQRAMIAVSGAYTFDNLSVSGDVYRTNTVPTGAFRGFGAPQMMFAVEMFIHHIAAELKADPLEFRLNYLAKQGDRTSTSGLFRDPIIMKEMIQKAMEMSEYQKKAKKYSKSDSHRGIGMSWFLHGCGFTGDGEANHIKAVVRLEKTADDQVEILVAATDMGQGVKTTFPKLVAHILEIPIEQVTMKNPDTNRVPDSGPTVASRTMMVVGGLLARAAKSLKACWKSGEAQAVEKHYKQPEYIEWNQDTLIGDAYPAYSWGVNIVEVEMNPLTYEISVEGAWSVYDVGKAIDEQVCLGQADGGLLQGIGYGYLEVMQAKNGLVQQRSVTDYIISTAVDAPPMTTVLMENPFALGPYGAKGVGELTLIGGAPAVALAIEMAAGKQVKHIPASPETLMELMEDE